MNDKLPPEVRVKVAEACAPSVSDSQFWNPEEVLHHKDALTRTAARLIEAEIDDRPGGRRADCWTKAHEYLLRLNSALATDDVNDLERLVAELKGFL